MNGGKDKYQSDRRQSFLAFYNFLVGPAEKFCWDLATVVGSAPGQVWLMQSVHILFKFMLPDFCLLFI